MTININNNNVKYTIRGDLYSAKFGNSDLLAACGKEDVQCVWRILESGLDPNFRTAEGRTPLMLASRDGHIGVVGELLAHKANVDMQDENEATALIMAAVMGHTKIVKALLAGGADVDMQDKNGWTALMKAARNGHTDVVQELLAGGADVDMRDRGEWTALMKAANAGHTEIVKALLAGGADVDMQDKDGWTALMKAVNADHMETEIIQELLEHGANICLVASNGKNALRVLRERSFPGYAQIKTELALSPESKEYKDFYRIVKNVCHAYGIKGTSYFGDISFERLGLFRGEYYSSIFAKTLSLFCEETKDRAVQKALSNICQTLEEHASSTDVCIDERAKRYAKGTPILVSGGFRTHFVIYCFWNTHCILVNRGAGSRKPIEIFLIEEKKYTDPAFFKGLLSEIRRIGESGTEAGFKNFVNDEFRKSYYLRPAFKNFVNGELQKSYYPHRTALEKLLEEVLALPEQTVGNCGFASTEGAVFVLFALEALHAKGLLNQGECDGARQGEIREVVERQREIFDEFSASLKARYRDKYRTEVSPERWEGEIVQTIFSQSFV